MESDWLAEIRKLASDNKILALKRYREHTNVGLKEAMEAVQALQAGQTVLAPARPPNAVEALVKQIKKLN